MQTNLSECSNKATRVAHLVEFTDAVVSVEDAYESVVEGGRLLKRMAQ